MTPQEAQMLQDMVRKVAGTPLTEKDPDAEALLNDGLARDPDAIYKLAQTVLIQDMALHQAQARIQQLTAASEQLSGGSPPQQPARASSFLGSLLHRNQPAAPPSQPQYQPVNAPPQYQAAPQYYQQAPPPSGGGSSFLRSAATTAAGVAAGALAFQGIEDLIHGGSGYGGFGGPMSYGGFGGAPVEETVVNNYYDDPSQGANAANIPGPDEQPQGPYDAADQGNIPGPDEQPQGAFDDASYDPGSDSGSDMGGDQGFDDQGGFDDGGGFDSGGDDLI